MKKPRNDAEESETREAGPKKKKFGLSVREIPHIDTPHISLIGGMSGQTGQPVPDQTENETVPSTPRLSSVPSTPSNASVSSETGTPSVSRSARSTRSPRTPSSPSDTSTPISPVSNFTKTPNSNVKNAIPEGYYRSGKSKQVYDVLYGLTRGAIVPTRTVRITRGRLMKLAGVGSKVTIDTILSAFIANGLLKIDFRYGEHDGNEIEVFIYDEIKGDPSISSDPSTTSAPSQTSQPSSPQKLRTLGNLESSIPRQTLSEENTNTSGNAKTLFKDFLNPDDERAVSDAFEKLVKAGTAATGKPLSQRDWAGFCELVDMFIDETEKGRSRTGQISNYVAFGVENLRRRLYAKPVDNGRSRSRPDAAVNESKPISDEEARQIAEEFRILVRDEIEAQGTEREVSQDERLEWLAIFERVTDKLEIHVVESWFQHIEFGGIDRDRSAVLIKANESTKDWITRYYSDHFRDALAAVDLSGFTIEWMVPPASSEEFKARFSADDWAKIEGAEKDNVDD